MMERNSRYDAKNDQLLDKLLKEEPGYILSDDFADHLAKKIEIHQSIKQNLIEFLTITGTVLTIIITFGCICYFVNKENFQEVRSMLLSSYTPSIIVIALFILFMDKVLLRLLNQLK